MKKMALRAERKIFPSFELKFVPSAAVKFVAQCLLLFLLASVPKFGLALALALFCGLVYARQNVLALAPIFVLACCVFTLNPWTALYSVTPVLALIVLYAVFFKLKRNVPLWAVAAAMLVGFLPYIVCECVLQRDYLTVAVSVALATVCAFASGICMYAVFVRGPIGRRTVEECICGGMMLLAAFYALSGVHIYSFYVYHFAVGAGAVFLSMCFAPQVTLSCAIVCGLGASIAFGSLSCLARIVLIAGAAVAFSPFTKFSSALAVAAAEGIMWLLGLYVGACWQAMLLLSLGAVAALVVPKKVQVRICDMLEKDNKRTYGGIVNRRGRELAGKLSSASDVFYALSGELKNAGGAEDLTPERLARDIARSYCGKCRDRDVCFGALGEDTHGVLLPMVEAALGRGKVTILDMPPFITSRCSNMHSLAAVINSSAEAFGRRRELAEGAEIGKRMMSEQFAGISLVLDSLAAEAAKPVNFSGGDVEFIKAELMRHNIVASEVVVAGDGKNTSVSVLVRAADAQKAVLEKLLSKLLRTKLETVRIEDRGDRRIAYLESSPVFEVAYGVAEKVRSGEQVSGDSRSILCPSRTQRLFAICDGMGSGAKACEASKSALAMVEGFYRLGIDSAVILSLVNKLLRLSLDDCFSSMDIAVVDATSGGLDVIKLGSAPSFVVREGSIEVLSSTQPPVGILDEVKPVTCRYQLYDGDMLIMMSDGVYDALETEGVVKTVEALDTLNPQSLADELLLRAINKGAEDDCTVLAMRLISV